MKTTLLLILLFSFSTVKADYIPPSLNKLILKADILVYGEIVQINNSDIVVSVEGSVNYSSDTIRIAKFKEWECGKRWEEYKIGDLSLFFLKAKNGINHPMGGGNEGELPIHGDEIYVHKSTISGLSTNSQFKRSTRPIENDGFNTPYDGFVINFNDMWQTIKLIRKCFKSDVSPTGSLINIQQLCPTEDLDPFVKVNPLLDYSVKKLSI